MAHLDLISDRNETPRQMIVVFTQHRDSHHDIVNVVEYKRSAVLVLLFSFQES